MQVNIPGLKIISVANRREHWGEKARRAREHRKTAWAMCLSVRAEPPKNVRRITLTRLYPLRAHATDTDNRAIAFKNFRDGIADYLGIDDGSKMLSWVYAEEVAKDWAVRIEFE